MKCLFHFTSSVVVFCGWLLSITPILANIPGGGNGTGANVTLVNNGDGTVTLSNGIVAAKIQISTAQVTQLTYNGIQVTDGGSGGNTAFFWQGQDGSVQTLKTMVDPSTNSGSMAMIQIFDSYTNSGAYADAYRYFAMFRGSPGLYVSEAMVHTPAMPAGDMDIPSFTCKLNTNVFNWLAQDTGRNLPMPTWPDLNAAQGVYLAPLEVHLLTQGQFAGRYECKYDYSGKLGELGFSGWCTTSQTTNFGLWMVHPSNEYFTAGPLHEEILAQMMILNGTFKGVHDGFSDDLTVNSGETWAKVVGPFLLYFNKVAPGSTNPQTALYSDAVAQTAAERGAWPYGWFTDTNYAKASGRGVVLGKFVIADSGNPNASSSNLWVGLAQQMPSTNVPPPADFQQWGKCYQYWMKADAVGNFVFTNVTAGTNYTLFAFGPGAIGQFQSQPLSGVAAPVVTRIPGSPFSVTVTAGQTNNLGNVTWTAPRVGATVFEIGVADRDTTEFRHGDDFWHGDIGNATNFPYAWIPWYDYPWDFPNGMTYIVGQSHWKNDWNYAQGTSLDPVTGDRTTAPWTISFNLPKAPTNNAPASLYIGVASSYNGNTIIKVNGTDITGNSGKGFDTIYDTNTKAMVRMHSHGIFADYQTNFSASLLHQGTNTITMQVYNNGGNLTDMMMDYVRLELGGYVPPAPASLSANAGSGLVFLFWPAAPGAVAYNVLRSTTSGSGYSAVATNIIGPTCGSVDDTAAFADTNVVNGTTYYYVVQSANQNGTSNSVQVSATPSAGTSAAPATPTNLTSIAGNNSVALKWNASPGAARYIIQRTVLTLGAVTTYTPGGINPYAVITSYVTGTNYTDTALANNVVYSYIVSAANANGQSTNSTAVTAVPLPIPPNAPTGLSVSVVSNQITLSWGGVSSATTYAVYRANAVSGPYTVIDIPEPLTFSIDPGLNYNTTYYYKVTASNLGGVSTNSTAIAATTTPPAPAPITAIPGNAQVFVDWGDSAGATNYVLQRATVNGGPYTTILSTTSTSYLDTGRVNGTTYYYVVYAVGPNGTGPLSAQTTATPSAIPQMIKSDTTSMNTAADWSGVAPTTNGVGLFNNIISAANALALVLGGDVSLDGLVFTNSMNGSVFVAAGNTLTLGDNGIDMSKANQSVTFSNAIALAATQVWNITNSRTLTINGDFTSASNTVIKTGGGTLALGGTSSDAGANIQVNSGTVQANASSGIKISLNGGTFNVNIADSNPINVISGGTEQNVGGNRTWSGNLAGSGPLTVISSATHTWSGNNSNYTGTITVQGSGILRLSTLTASSPTTAYNMNGGTMAANVTGLLRLGSLGGSGVITNFGAGQNFSIGALGLDSSFSGVIGGSVFLVKEGNGILTLSGNNTYTGGTTISNGTLLVANASGSGTGSGPVTVNSGGTLGGNGIVSGPTAVKSGGALTPGINGIGTFTFSNSLALNGGSTSYFDIRKSPVTNDMAMVFGVLTNGGTLIVANTGATSLTNGDGFKLFSAASYAGTFDNVILPSLASGLAWNTNALNTNGTIFVIALTSPTISGVERSGSNLVLSGSGGPPNWGYVVVMTTNLPAGWTPVQTNQFDALGNFSISLTNAIGPGQGSSFYRLQLQ